MASLGPSLSYHPESRAEACKELEFHWGMEWEAGRPDCGGNLSGLLGQFPVRAHCGLKLLWSRFLTDRGLLSPRYVCACFHPAGSPFSTTFTDPAPVITWFSWLTSDAGGIRAPSPTFGGRCWLSSAPFLGKHLDTTTVFWKRISLDL